MFARTNKHLIFYLFYLSILFAPCGIRAVTPPIEPSPIPNTATPEWQKDGWTLLWHDEFDGPAINPAYWTHDVGGHGWGNAELQYYSDRPVNSFIEEGQLVIQALAEEHEGLSYTSARLITMDKVEVAYGRVEARIQLPHGQGIWSAFWLMGADFPEVGWPQSGEIDIMEHIGQEPRRIHATVHGPGYSGNNSIGASYDLPRSAAAQFHIFAIEWEPEQIRWYVDNTRIHTVTPADLPGKWVFDHPFFLLLNVAVGGNWPGPPDKTTEFPQQMRVDYVRIYTPNQ
jgi:beta-glucanase (GH16 family)